jgi:hypothetical protein
VALGGVKYMCKIFISLSHVVHNTSDDDIYDVHVLLRINPVTGQDSYPE